MTLNSLGIVFTMLAASTSSSLAEVPTGYGQDTTDVDRFECILVGAEGEYRAVFEKTSGWATISKSYGKTETSQTYSAAGWQLANLRSFEENKVHNNEAYRAAQLDEIEEAEKALSQSEKFKQALPLCDYHWSA